MIVAYLCGGLGNQMFQYAMARRLAEKHQTGLLLDTHVFAPGSVQRRPELKDFYRQLSIFKFRIKAREATPAEIKKVRDAYWRSTTRDRAVRVVRRFWPTFLWKKSHLRETQYQFQPEALCFPDNVYVQGYWQSEKYFADIAPIIRNEFTVVDQSVTDSAVAAIAKLKQRFREIVSLHIRRGDNAYAHEKLQQKNITSGAPLSMEYIREAMNRFGPDTGFLVFSDTPEDIQWCRENVHAPNLEFSDATSETWDFTAMRYCDHNIIGNSTYSWWAAWLNPNPDRRVISPRRWSPPEAATQMVLDDLIPPNWTII